MMFTMISVGSGSSHVGALFERAARGEGSPVSKFID